VAILAGFAPWIVYWVLVGNVPFTVAVLAALAAAVLSFAVGRVKGASGRTLELGGIGTFVVLTVLTFTLSQEFMERWVQPLSSAGIFLVALTGVLVGRPFVREFAEVDQAPEVVKSELFGRITTLVTWIWVGAFAGRQSRRLFKATPRSWTPEPHCRSSATGSSRSCCCSAPRWPRAW
jgi:hypothetical protein